MDGRGHLLAGRGGGQREVLQHDDGVGSGGRNARRLVLQAGSLCYRD